MASWSFGPSSGNRDLRIGTAEREQAVQLLSEHLSAGRLELAEFEERVSAAYAARTAGQLADLFRDLPGMPPATPQQRATRVRLPRRAILLVILGLVVAGLVTEVTFPPFLPIALVFLVLKLRHRWRYAAAGYRRRW